MKISQLPKEIRIAALKYQINTNQRRDMMTDNLQYAFDWGDTEEGAYYWIERHKEEFIEEQVWKVTTTDTIVLSVIEDLNSRSILGINKYKTTLDRKDLSRKDWLQHAYEECLDQANYLKKLISLEK
jgi:hypothetical protein